jgi:hypothetical protein
MDFASAATEVDRCISSGLLVDQEARLHKQALVKLVEEAASNAVLTVCYNLMKMTHETTNLPILKRMVAKCSHSTVVLPLSKTVTCHQIGLQYS